MKNDKLVIVKFPKNLTLDLLELEKNSEYILKVDYFHTSNNSFLSIEARTPEGEVVGRKSIKEKEAGELTNTDPKLYWYQFRGEITNDYSAYSIFTIVATKK